MATIIPYLVAGGSLWTGNSVIVTSGAVLVDRDGVNWQSWDANTQANFAGHRVGICTNGGIITPGQPGLAIQLLGPLSSENFNVGPGNASTVVVGTNNQLTRGIVGQVMGICDASGSVIVFPTIVGSTPTGQRIIGEIAGYPLNPTPLQVNQTWVWDGSQMSPSTVTGGGGGSVTWANDLVNSTSTNQYVSGLSYSSAPAGGSIAVNGTNTLLNWVTNAVTLQQNAVTLLQLKQAATDFVATGVSPQSATGFHRNSNNSLAVAARNAGNTGDINLLASDSSNNAVVGGGTQGSGGVLHKVSATTVLQQQILSTDYAAFGVTPAASGFVRVTNNTIAVKARNQSNNGDVSLIGTDGSDNILVGGGTQLTAAVVVFRTSATNIAQIATISGNPQLAFYDAGFTGASNGGAIGWTSANTAGQGMNLAIVAQAAKATSGANGGQVTIASGAGDGAGSDGGINFGFNLTFGGGISDRVQFIGAATSAARGNLQWSQSITPLLNQANAANAVQPKSFTLSPQAPNGASASALNNTPGFLIVNIPLYGTVGVQGQSGVFTVQENSQTQFLTGNLNCCGGATNQSGVWVGAGVNGLSPGPSNAAIINYTGAGAYTMFNGATSLILAQGGNTCAVFTTSLASYQVPVGGSSGNNNPFQWATVGSAVSIVGSPTLTSAQYSCPIIPLTGSTGVGVTITLPNKVGAMWIFDLQNVTFSTGGITFTTGSGTTTVLPSTGPTTPCKGVVVYIPASNVVSMAF